ncbi:Hypothetical protein CINCED_3A018681 [Cinara cedri]|uniref:Uncharacterized protein n=1 Tax=Cinara cedri TaxID=506608 RepID=A0A5E4NC81_9HEMI|nr:Hypothetical protein CINCED_3A018681 [Cinara cedri]
MYRDRLLTVCLCVLVTAVTGNPHECLLEEYRRALLAHYNLSPAAVAAAEPVPYDYEAAGLRPGRSNDAGAKPGVPQHVLDPAAAREPTAPCKATLAQPAKGVNDTSSMATVEKLSAYYDHLKNQQELLARQQHQHQLFELQQRRQQEFILVQQQIQQQYLQQQQHALFMLEQLRKNPAFAGQLAAFAGTNGTDVPNNEPAGKEPPAAVNKGTSPTKFVPAKEQTIANHAEVQADDCGANKRVGLRQTVAAKIDRSSDAEDDDPEDVRYSNSEYDDQTADDENEKPAVMKKVYRVSASEADADENSMADAKSRAAASRMKIADGCGSKRPVTRRAVAAANQPSYSGTPFAGRGQTQPGGDGDVPPTMWKLANEHGVHRHLAARQAVFGVDPSFASENVQKADGTATE